MKVKILVTLAISQILTSYAQTGDPNHQETSPGSLRNDNYNCVNGDKFPDCPDCNDEPTYVISTKGNIKECEANGNPYSILSGNVMRSIKDLTFWNTPGAMTFSWIRSAASRQIDSGAPTYFGDGHQWLHNWDITLVDAGLDPITNRKLIEIRYSSGYLSIFRENAGSATFTPINGDWKGQDRLYKKSIIDGDDFDGYEVLTGAGKALRFVENDFGSGTFYRLEEFVDKHQNVFTLTYENGTVDKLIRVTAPGGAQYFDVTWGSTLNGFDVITTVTSSDGRSVNYVYNELIDPSDASSHDGLTSVDYSDGTFAKYRYNWERFASGRPLLDEASDPRVVSGARVVGYEWYGWLFGMISKETNLFDGSLLSGRVENTTSGLVEITNGVGSTQLILPTFFTGKINQHTNSTGGRTNYTYGGYLNRITKSITDSNAEKKTISWSEGLFLRPTRVFYDEDGGLKHEERCTYTNTGLLTKKIHAPAGGGWHVTTYTRNTSGHLTKIQYPGGSTELWTRDQYGNPLTHTLRNGATESWTYNAQGLQATHIGPAKAGETGTTQSWTYYSNGLVHVHTLPTGGTITYEYNEVGQTTKEIYDDGSYIERDYTGTLVGANNQQFYDLTTLKKHDPANGTIDIWSYTYDPFGRKESETDPEGHTMTWSYGDAGQGICNTCTTRQSPLKVTSAEGRVTRYIYDREWRPLLMARLADGDGSDNDYEAMATLYDNEGRVLYTIDNIVLNNIDPTTLDFEDYAQVGRYVINASWTSYGYDLRGRQVSVTRWDGGIPTEIFNEIPFAGLLGVSEGIGYTTTRDYDSLGNLRQVVAPGGRLTTMSYPNGRARVMREMASQTISPDGGNTQYTTSYAYTNGELIRVTDALGRNTTMTYNGRGQYLLTTYADGTSTENIYNAAGLLSESDDKADRTTIYGYDNYGRTISTSVAGRAPSLTNYRVLSLGGVETATAPTGEEMEYTYYRDGLRLETIMAPNTAEEAVTTSFYDGDDNMTSMVDPVGVESSYSYDLLGRQVSRTVPGTTASAADLLTTLYQYDTENDTVTMVYPDGNTSVTVSDDLGRTISVTNENSETIAYAYFQETSWMTSLLDARGKETNWSYDDLGQVLTKEYPTQNGSRQTDVYSYDVVQRLSTHTRPSGKMATYSYEPNTDYLVGITWSATGFLFNGENQTYTYFSDGRLESASNGITNLAYTYHPNGDLNTEEQTFTGTGLTVSYNHDDSGRLADLTYPLASTDATAESVAYRYNLRSQLSEVYNPDDGATSPLATYTRNLDGLPSILQYDNGARTNYYYDAGKRSTGRYHYRTNGNWLDNNIYGYDNRSRRIWQRWAGNTGDRYEYDNAGQLTKTDYNVTAPQAQTSSLIGDHQYQYDDMGNRESFTVLSNAATTEVPAQTTSYTANNLNQYQSVSNAPTNPPNGNWVYDDDGNLTDDGTRLYTWDAWNRLRFINDKATGESIAYYVYDTKGRRVFKSIAAESTRFIYDGWNIIQEWKSFGGSPTSTLHAYLVWGNDVSGSKQGAGGVGGLLYRKVIGGQSLYYHYDANGNVVRLTNATNNSGLYRYDAFGNIREESGYLLTLADNPWKFSTKYQDEESGWSYYGYRYYDPVTGRWPSRDPIEESGGHNLYGFVGNNPLNKYDYLGWIKQGDNIDVLCPLGEGVYGPPEKIGHIEVKQYKATTGTVNDPVKGQITGGGANFEVIFHLDKENQPIARCCCKGGKFQWIQTVIEDTGPSTAAAGKKVPYIDGDGAKKPYYRADPGDPPRLFDGPIENAHNLWPLDPQGPRSVRVKFKTQLVCPAEKDKVLAELEWGFEFSVDLNRNPKFQSKEL